MEKKCLSIKETAAELGISVGTLRYLMSNEGLPNFHASPRRILIPVSGLEEWLKQRTTNAVAAAAEGKKA